MKKTDLKTLITIILTYTISVFFMSFINQDNTPWVAPENSKTTSNPIEANKISVDKGMKIFNQQCWSCHGKNGNGNGPAAKALKAKPADFSKETFQNQTDGEIYWKISNGRGEMAGYKNSLKDENRWQLVNFLRTFKK